jgi:death on curing protein
MIRYLSLEQILDMHADAIRSFGGDPGVRDFGLIESAVAQPRMTFGGEDLYPSLVEKAAALGFSLVSNHGFVDGNKRVGFAAMDAFLRANGYKVSADVGDAEAVTLGVASRTVSREQFTDWVRDHCVPVPPETT